MDGTPDLLEWALASAAPPAEPAAPATPATAMPAAPAIFVIACGDRNWSDPAPVRDALAALPPGSTVVSGGCRGADQIAAQAASALGLKSVVVLADWGAYGRAAGPIRNQLMLDSYPVARVLAFHPCILQSRGTKHMTSIARRRGVPVVVEK